MSSKILPLLLLPICICAREDDTFLLEEMPTTPWFTGPQLALTPTNPTPGHPNIEPSVTFFGNYGYYQSNWGIETQPVRWTINPTLDFQFALSQSLGMEIYLSAVSNFQSGQSFTHLQDTYFGFGYQISNDTRGSWVPDFRIVLQELFPTGKYQKLSPQKNGIDATGQGSFQTGLALVFQKSFHFPHHVFSLQGSVDYYFPTSVAVKGINYFGGAPDTKGRARPGQTFSAFISGQYSITRHWAFAFDTNLLFQRSSHFSGKKGSALSVTLPPLLQISAAPAIEYNFSATSGLLFGSWFTIAGRNSFAFASLFFSYVYTF